MKPKEHSDAYGKMLGEVNEWQFDRLITLEERFEFQQLNKMPDYDKAVVVYRRLKAKVEAQK